MRIIKYIRVNGAPASRVEIVVRDALHFLGEFELKFSWRQNEQTGRRPILNHQSCLVRSSQYSLESVEVFADCLVRSSNCHFHLCFLR